MSPLNNAIKSIFLFGETLLLIASLFIGIAATLALNGRVLVLRFLSVRDVSLPVAIVSFFMTLCTLYACVGASRQIKRGTCCWSGRKMLCIHKITLICVTLYCCNETYSLHQRRTSIEHTLAALRSSNNNATNAIIIPYDAFEQKLSQAFNEVYYLSHCNHTTTHLVKRNKMSHSSFSWTPWIEKNCPISSILNSKVCIVYNENQCTVIGVNNQCPFDLCRQPMLDAFDKVLLLLVQVLIVLSSLTIAIIILSCLLICYNPRDAIEIELFKTGVVSEDDVELISRLQAEKRFEYKTGDRDGGSHINSKNSSFIDLEMLRKSAHARKAAVPPASTGLSFQQYV